VSPMGDLERRKQSMLSLLPRMDSSLAPAMTIRYNAVHPVVRHRPPPGSRFDTVVLSPQCGSGWLSNTDRQRPRNLLH